MLYHMSTYQVGKQTKNKKAPVDFCILFFALEHLADVVFAAFNIVLFLA